MNLEEKNLTQTTTETVNTPAETENAATPPAADQPAVRPFRIKTQLKAGNAKAPAC
jgi:hypothetical protein